MYVCVCAHVPTRQYSALQLCAAVCSSRGGCSAAYIVQLCEVLQGECCRVGLWLRAPGTSISTGTSTALSTHIGGVDFFNSSTCQLALLLTHRRVEVTNKFGVHCTNEYSVLECDRACRAQLLKFWSKAML